MFFGLLLLLTANGFIRGDNVLQCEPRKCNNTHHKKNITRHVCKITKRIKNSIWPIRNQERIEPKEVKSILQTTGYTKQWIIHTTHTQLHTSPTPSPHYPCILFTSHPALIPFLSLHIAGLHSTSFSLHIWLFNPCSWKYSISSVLQIPFTSHHLPISQTSPPLYLIFPHLKSSSLHL